MLNLKTLPPSARPISHTDDVAPIFARYDSQVGEFGWHAIHVDETLDTVSEQHAASILSVVHRTGVVAPRILELGAYAHYSSQIAAERTGGESVSHDISAASVIEGQKRALMHGYGNGHISVAGDFHDLPFADGAFDVVFIASAIHHTRRPGDVMREMVRVTREGGAIIIENEPVGRTACLYQFRGNREGERTAFEEEIERRRLTWTVSSPFPGSRAEELFGMVENDCIPLTTYEDVLLGAGSVVQWTLDSYALMGPFETWLLSRPRAHEIAERLLRDMDAVAPLFSTLDKACGFSVPKPDQKWSLAYRIERALDESNDSTGDASRLNATLFGAALKACILKSGQALRGSLMRRELREQDGVLIDDAAMAAYGLKFSNILPEPAEADFGPDWTLIHEANGYDCIANNGAVNHLQIDLNQDGVLVLRTYSIAQDEPYWFSITVDDRLAYRHCVAFSESHLAKVSVKSGEAVRIWLSDENGDPISAELHARIIPKFIPLGVPATEAAKSPSVEDNIADSGLGDFESAPALLAGTGSAFEVSGVPGVARRD